MNNIKMLYFNRIYVSEGIGVNKKCIAKECIICLYLYSRCLQCLMSPTRCLQWASWCINGFYEPYQFSILNIHGVDYCCIISGTGKSETKDLFKNANLNEKSGTL